MNDAEFLRDLAKRLDNGQDVERLDIIADLLDQESLSFRRDEKNVVVTGQPVSDPSSAPLKYRGTSWSPEYDWNPTEEEETKWLNFFTAQHERDLVAEVRQELKNAMEGGVDMLSELGDEELAADIKDKADGYDGVELRLMTFAVRAVRRDPTGVYP